tara:strand:- start:147 stop:671 length:525 start_codon:yes stop_codon:yes gene_type:complete
MILLNDLSTHKEQKQILLDRIEKYKINKHCLKIKENEIMYTDYDFYTPEKLFKDDFFEHKEMSELLANIGTSINMNLFGNFSVNRGDAWFKQYYQNAEHTWHNHSNAQFTNIYFLELPDEKYKTEICGLNGKLIEYEATEGQILTIPAFLLHRSKPNGTKRKTIISWNTNYQSA